MSQLCPVKELAQKTNDSTRNLKACSQFETLLLLFAREHPRIQFTERVDSGPRKVPQICPKEEPKIWQCLLATPVTYTLISHTNSGVGNWGYRFSLRSMDVPPGFGQEDPESRRPSPGYKSSSAELTMVPLYGWLSKLWSLFIILPTTHMGP